MTPIAHADTQSRVITAIEIRPEDMALYESCVSTLRGIASRGAGKVWTFVHTGELTVKILGCELIPHASAESWIKTPIDVLEAR